MNGRDLAHCFSSTNRYDSDKTDENIQQHSSWTRVCLLPTGAEAYISDISELIFKVCFGDDTSWF